MHAFRRFLMMLTCVVALGPSSAWCEPVDFNSQIKPILSDRCFACHGPDSAQRQADLRLDTRSGAFARLTDARAGQVLKPGLPQQSELYLRITADDPETRMPPPDSKLGLTAAEVELIRRWIAEGAEWKSHWAYTAPRRPPVPEAARQDWSHNAIDRFTLRAMEQRQLTPAPATTREKLLRRVSFDLTGLPPTTAELDAFLNDKTPQAYETVVNRLLDSERFGERMAADWLDVARYSDTYGYQVDRDRFVWPWRDWVIRAWNDNLPYDQFITQQLAGDLLPNATDQQVLATAFNRLHSQKVEGGSTPEEFRVEYVSDRTHTFATAFLGLTLECARCHEHKFDPVSHEEYYQLFAFFNNIDEAGLYSYFTPSVPTPTLFLADQKRQAQLESLKLRVADVQRQLAAVAEQSRPRFDAWLDHRNDPNRAPTDKPPSKATDQDSPTAQPAGPAASAPKPVIPDRIALLDFEKHGGGANVAVPRGKGRAVKLSGDDGIGLKVGNFRRFEPFSVSLWMNTPDRKQRAVVFHRSRAWTDAGSRGYQLLIEDGCLSASLIHFWPGNAIRIRTRKPIPTDDWLHVAMTYDGSSAAAGLTIYLNGKAADTVVVQDQLYKHITGGGGDNITIGQRFRDRGFTNGLVDDFMVYRRRLESIEVAQLHDQDTLTRALQTAKAQLNASQRESLFRYYLATADPAYKKQLSAVQQAREAYNKLQDGMQEIMVMRERAHRRPTFVLRRGAYDDRGKRVGPGTPAVFPEFPANAPRNRLGLARWLTQGNHPLTARVAVNRLWQMCFGRGLVRTPEDFGVQGALPTHPELLDWLAVDFMDHGWDVKRMLKQIVLSATYRQSSTTSETQRNRDPENLFLSYMAPVRLPAEMLRDNALAVSGLLVNRVGGQSARPYEVAQSFKPVGHDKGEGLYRRSLYTYWKRTGPAPVMMALDASKREVCRMRRERTSSPIQALVLINGPQFVEAARFVAQRMLTQHGTDDDDALRGAFRLLTSREPNAKEQQILTRLFQQQLSYFEQNLEAAEQYLKVGHSPRDPKQPAARLAALSVVVNTLFNFDECVMKR